VFRRLGSGASVFVEDALRFGECGRCAGRHKPLFLKGLGVVMRRWREAGNRGLAGAPPARIGSTPSFSLDDSRDLAVQ
jgi:hypothetical protein